jgi:hypothetical protein
MSLPKYDVAIEALSVDDRSLIGAAWTGRSASEGGAAENFRLISRCLRDARAADELIAVAEASVADELRHATLCLEVASVYLDRALALPPPIVHAPPTFDRAPAQLVPLLHLVGNCCYNETTATAYLEMCMRAATGPIVRAALRELLSDDVDHARLGWSSLASTLTTTPSLAPLLSTYVLPLAKLNLRTWQVGRGKLDAFPAHGCPSRADVDATVIESLRTLILPGLERAGLDVNAARTWLDELVRAPTSPDRPSIQAIRRTCCPARSA